MRTLFLLIILIAFQSAWTHGAYSKAKLQVRLDSLESLIAEHENYIADDMRHKLEYHRKQNSLKIEAGQASSNLIKIGDGVLAGRIIDAILGFIIAIGAGSKVLVYLKSKGIVIKFGRNGSEDSGNP